MAEWIDCKLSDIGEIVGGATPSTKDPANYDGDIAWLTPKDLSTFTERFIEKGERSITEKGYKSCSTKMLPTNSILFSSRAPIGYVAIAAKELCTNQGFKSVIPNAKVDFLFLYYLLKYKKNAIEGMGSGTTFKEVSGNVMKNIDVRIPKDISVQKRIAEILDRIDSKIENNNAINRNLSDQVILGFNNLMDSMNDEYDEVTLSDLCFFQEGYVNPSQNHQEYFDGDIKWLRAVDINESFIVDTSRTLTQAGFESAKKSALLFDPNTIAISKSGTIGRLGIIADYMCGNRAVINIKPKEDKMLPFVYAYLKSRQREFPDLAVGSVQKNLYVSVLEPLKVPIPKDMTYIQRYCDMARMQLDHMLKLCLENKNLVELRDTLLPKLLSGELDVSKLEI